MRTALADYLVRRGIPFRESHNLVGQAEALDLPLREMPLEAYQVISPACESDLYRVLDFEAAVERRDVTGGTAPSQVARALAEAKESLAEEG